MGLDDLDFSAGVRVGGRAGEEANLVVDRDAGAGVLDATILAPSRVGGRIDHRALRPRRVRARLRLAKRRDILPPVRARRGGRPTAPAFP